MMLCITEGVRQCPRPLQIAAHQDRGSTVLRSCIITY